MTYSKTNAKENAVELIEHAPGTLPPQPAAGQSVPQEN